MENFDDDRTNYVPNPTPEDIALHTAVAREAIRRFLPKYDTFVFIATDGEEFNIVSAGNPDTVKELFESGYATYLKELNDKL